MPPKPLVLAFDTSAAHCAAALVLDDEVLAVCVEPMQKGQAERLAVLLEEVLHHAGYNWSDLSAIVVCTGPGNFTGVRIAVSFARGFALAQAIPAIGVSKLEALAHQQSGVVTATLDARRDRVYVQEFCDGGATNLPRMIERQNLPQTHLVTDAPVSKDAASNVEIVDPETLIIATAKVALDKLGQDHPRPAPLYLRPADAALPSDPPPVILS